MNILPVVGVLGQAPRFAQGQKASGEGEGPGFSRLKTITGNRCTVYPRQLAGVYGNAAVIGYT